MAGVTWRQTGETERESVFDKVAASDTEQESSPQKSEPSKATFRCSTASERRFSDTLPVAVFTRAPRRRDCAESDGRGGKGEGDRGEGVQPELRDAGVWARLPCVGRVTDLHGGDLAVGRGGGKKGEEKGMEGEKMRQVQRESKRVLCAGDGGDGVERTGETVRRVARELMMMLEGETNGEG